MKKRDDLLQMSFALEGSSITVSGRDVAEADVRALATSLETYDRADWRAALGERLLVDEPE